MTPQVKFKEIKFYFSISSKSLGQLCLHVEIVKNKNVKKYDALPEYNCLVLSPANIWQRSLQSFNQDNNLVNTIYSYPVIYQILFFFW